MKLRGDPILEMTGTLRDYAKSNNCSFILEGELYFLDYKNSEHRTGAQAASVNVEAGKGEIPVLTRYMPFYAIYMNRDLRPDTYTVRILEGNAIARDLSEMSPIFEVPFTARTTEEKKELAQIQYIGGREGEVWFSATAPYHAGKDHSDSIVRTKYMSEFKAVVTALTPTTAQGRLFGAIVISDLNGKPIGAVGTGFDRTTQQKIWDQFHAGQLVIPVISQGFTEDGMAWLARLDADEFNA